LFLILEEISLDNQLKIGSQQPFRIEGNKPIKQRRCEATHLSTALHPTTSPPLK
jgi:hypothetical protein